MTFAELKNHFQNKPYLFSRDLLSPNEDPQVLRNQLGRWQKKGLIIPLKKGLYVLNETVQGSELNRNSIANICYEPSYVSLESALCAYGLIPEKVTDTTSVTTRKTARYSNKLGHFIYQHIKPAAFRGFKKIGSGANSFFMADPEKALVDFLYLNLNRFDKNPKEVLQQSYRLQNIEDLKSEQIIQFGKLFNNKKLMRMIKDLCRWIAEEKQ